MNKNIHALAHINDELNTSQALAASINSDDLFLPTDDTKVIYDGKKYGGDAGKDLPAVFSMYTYIDGTFGYENETYIQLNGFTTYTNLNQSGNTENIRNGKIDLSEFITYLDNRFVKKTP